MLTALAQDRRSPRVREAVARNRATPDFALAVLCDDADSTVARSAMSNPVLPAEVLSTLCDAVIARNNVSAAAKIAPHENLSESCCVALLDWVFTQPETGADGRSQDLTLNWLTRLLLDHPSLSGATRATVLDRWGKSAPAGSWQQRTVDSTRMLGTWWR